MLHPSENPAISFPLDRAIADFEGTWWVGHTKARCEKAFAWDMRRRGIAYFLPMGKRVSYCNGRKMQSVIPLFPSYVFFCGGDAERYTALTTDRLCQVIPVANQ